MNHFEPAALHQVCEFMRHGFCMAVSHWDRYERSRINVRFEVSLDVLRNEAGMLIVVERVSSYDNLVSG